MAYGARLESVLGASPRGFESPILRHRTPGPLPVPGFLLPVAPLVFRAPSGPATVCAAGRRPAREPSAPRASLGASSRSPARPRHRPRAPQPGPPDPPAPSTPVVPGVLIGAAHRLEARPGPAAAHRHRGRSLRRPPDQWRLVADVWLGALAAWMCCLVPAISHAIPLGLFQTMNSHRWDFNVF